MIARLKRLHLDGAVFVASANTIIELAGSRARSMAWALSSVDVIPVTRDRAINAAALLRERGLSGHTYALDASVAEVAVSSPGPVLVLTSDVPDMKLLTGGRSDVEAV
ncbi:MAG: hypothetical protein LBR58_06595 [Propionibacteriaceae bacterium]|nr:hypothetical protein [Propionibacteriaceae bacterium]